MIGRGSCGWCWNARVLDVLLVFIMNHDDVYELLRDIAPEMEAVSGRRRYAGDYGFATVHQ